MLRNVVANTTTFFYPFGNTPATCLTQDLPPEQKADILLLGCGDARNILFTTHAVSAKIWNIYYHLYLDDDSLELLDSQALKLLALADTLENWNSGQYGRALRFCDQRTFSKVKSLWAGYSIKHLSPDEKLDKQNRHQSIIDNARAAKREMMGEAISMSGLRSAAPVGVQALRDLPTLYAYFWEHGTVNIDEDRNRKPGYPNPAITSSPNRSLTLHYGLDPLLGFHLATAYVPLTPQSPLFTGHQQTSSVKTVVETARQQFGHWSKSFRQAIAAGSIVRFFTGDAIALCHTLQQANTAVNSGGNGATLYCDSWTFQPLDLDGGDYGGSACLAPVRFDIIDTSNLVDHLGALNILVATAPLLADGMTSTLYTEVLVQHESSIREMVGNILCGHLETVSLILGLVSVGSWTNATAVSEVDEGRFDAVLGHMKMHHGTRSAQSRTRLCWKKGLALSRQNPPLDPPRQLSLRPEIDAQDMSRLLYSVYQAMFCHEDVETLMAALKRHGTDKLSNPYYNRASFAALLKYVQSNVITDWGKSIDIFLDMIAKGASPSSLWRNYVQELYLYLHLSGIHTVQVLQHGAPKLFNIEAAKHLSSWDEVPSVLCITFEIPRDKLKVLEDTPLRIFGTPSLCCTVKSSGTSLQQWETHFSTVQAAFGSIHPVGNKNAASFRVYVKEDAESWAGTSPLVVSFFIPTWVVLQEPRTALVACRIQTSPHAAASFANKMGPELSIFKTSLGDDRIHITQFMPNMSAYPIFVANSTSLKRPTPSTTDQSCNTISANATDGGKIAGLRCKIDLVSGPAKAKLSDQTSLVELKRMSPMVFEIGIGKTIKCRALFPTPVSSVRSRLRVARKSSYVEVVAPLLSPLDADASPEFMFPLSIVPNTPVQGTAVPVNWNMPYVKVDVFPTLDTNKTSKMQWLTRHASLMFSSRERKLREMGLFSPAPSKGRKDSRVDFKDGLFSLMMHFTGVQGAQASVFGLHKAGAGGVHVLLFVSALKLDIANHTVILDTAVVPLSHKMTEDMQLQKFFGGLQSTQKLCSINVTDEEFRVWKHILPALAERCRTWKHKPASCEYLLKGEIPLSGGLQDGHTPLCSCGVGKIPHNFMGDLKVPLVDYVLEKYATRIAISPVFAVAYVEDCLLPGAPRGVGGSLNPEPPLLAASLPSLG